MNKQGNTKPCRLLPSAHKRSSDTTASSPAIVPTPATLEEPDPESSVLMEPGESSQATPAAGTAETAQAKDGKAPPTPPESVDDIKHTKVSTKKEKVRPKKTTKVPVKKSKRKEVSSDSDSGDNANATESESSDSSEEERAIRRKKAKAAAKKVAEKRKAQLKARERAKKRKSKKYESSDDSSLLDSDSDVDSEEEKKGRKRKAKAKKKSKVEVSSSDDLSSSLSESETETESDSEVEKKKQKKRKQTKAKKKSTIKRGRVEIIDSSSGGSDTEENETPASTPDTMSTEATASDAIQAQLDALQAEHTRLKLIQQQLEQSTAGTSVSALSTLMKKMKTAKTEEKTPEGKKNALIFKRLDQVWDSKIRDYKYTESVEEQKDEFDCVFTVRRKFGWESKYLETQVDIKSKLLRNALQVIFKDCKSISLVEDTPSIHPHHLFHYYDEIAAYIRKTLKPQLKRTKKKKEKKQLEQQIAQCKLLLRYIDEDFEDTRKTLKPMLKAGTITYNLVWALFKPNTIAYTPTYGNKDDPRCFKVDMIREEEDWFGVKRWDIDGRYLEYDGKVFGLGEHYLQIKSFKGAKRIVSLEAYPLKFHKDPEGLREQLIERGKKFVALQGMNYRYLKGLGYQKQKHGVYKIAVDGRVMVDPALFRRLNPNYLLSYIKQDEIGEEDPDDDSDDGNDDDCSENDESCDEKAKRRLVMWKDKKGKKYLITVPASEDSPDMTSQRLDVVEDDDEGSRHVFTEEELLIASPVVLGFAFSVKAWLEFSLSGIKEIEWNTEAFDSLVLPKHIKQNLKGLVSSHRFSAAKRIDDVIQGKGKGLNVVLHGPPGVGKTLTGESIAEYLRCPLYAVSAGELGTTSRQLEQDLNRIMEITHAWGAILLLDEADVFLEARQPHDIHRNSLVSVFLRLTEYYQGILFLTTNRVATFDEAFQSRIHMGIRYENLTAKARKKIWQHHIGKVMKMAGQDDAHKCMPFQDSDYDELSKKVMNGRQIKNAVKTSQSIAMSEKGVFSMEYIKRHLEVSEAFEEDMRGGSYRDAMRQYT